MRLLFLLISVFTVLSCSSDSNGNGGSSGNIVCNKNAMVVTDDMYNELSSMDYTVDRVSLLADCLEVTISSSYCNIENGNINLITKESYFESDVPQRISKIKFVNNESCLGVFQKTISFNLRPYRIEGKNSIVLKIENWENEITYVY
jgi:hypothetical protein